MRDVGEGTGKGVDGLRKGVEGMGSGVGRCGGEEGEFCGQGAVALGAERKSFLPVMEVK